MSFHTAKWRPAIEMNRWELEEEFRRVRKDIQSGFPFDNIDDLRDHAYLVTALRVKHEFGFVGEPTRFHMYGSNRVAFTFVGPEHAGNPNNHLGWWRDSGTFRDVILSCGPGRRGAPPRLDTVLKNFRSSAHDAIYWAAQDGCIVQRRAQ